MNLMNVVEKEYAMNNEFPEFRAGDTITVHYKIKEGNKERIQQFRGVVLQLKGDTHTITFTVRKISNGVGVEKTMPVHSPKITEIKVIKRGKVRRANLNYLKGRVGKAAKIKTRKEK